MLDSPNIIFFPENSWNSRVDGEGAFLIDRCPIYFEALLNYLRQGTLILNEKVEAQGMHLLNSSRFSIFFRGGRQREMTSERLLLNDKQISVKDIFVLKNLIQFELGRSKVIGFARNYGKLTKNNASWEILSQIPVF